MRPVIRLWPGVTAAVLLFVARFVVPAVAPDQGGTAIIGSLVCGLLILVWWALFSRIPMLERWGGLAFAVVAVLATSRLVDKSIANGMMGMMFLIYAVPTVTLALVIWAVAAGRLPAVARRAALAAIILVACSGWLLLRTDGITGAAGSQLAWRWTPTAEERFLARVAAEPAPAPATAPAPDVEAPKPAQLGAKLEAPAAAPAAPVAKPVSTASWSGFRGSRRDGSIPGLTIQTNWTATPPVEIWRRPIGPGWSSFSVDGDLVYTQEQRGEDEVVACYDARTGNPVWIHRDAARFWESNAGAGPRGTPTISNGRVYTFGATGIVNALDAATGAVVWTRNAGNDAERKVPGWGFSSSPLVVGNVVIVAASGRMVGYDIATGAPRWVGPTGGGGYSSPTLLTVAGVPQVVLLNGGGAVSLAPEDGKVLWSHDWNAGGTPIVQPALTGDGDLLISGVDMSGGVGIRRLALEPGPSGWTVKERWTTRGLKPYFNDYVVHNGHAYGFDGSILACVDLKDGQRKWKGGRYGNGQMMLLADQSLLLVLSEEGELALVGASADQFRELARFPAIEGKTWNHPALAGDVLLVRNGQEMAAFRLPVARH